MGSEFDYTQAERWDRDITAGQYQKFYIETPIEEVEFTIGAMATRTVTVGVQVVDPAGDAIAEQFTLQLFLCSDDAGTTPAYGNVTVAEGADGNILVNGLATDTAIVVVTDDEGKVELDFTLASGALTRYLGCVLPNGKYQVSTVLTWTA